MATWKEIEDAKGTLEARMAEKARPFVDVAEHALARLRKTHGFPEGGLRNLYKGSPQAGGRIQYSPDSSFRSAWSYGSYDGSTTNGFALSWAMQLNLDSVRIARVQFEVREVEAGTYRFGYQIGGQEIWQAIDALHFSEDTTVDEVNDDEFKRVVNGVLEHFSDYVLALVT